MKSLLFAYKQTLKCSFQMWAKAAKGVINWELQITRICYGSGQGVLWGLGRAGYWGWEGIGELCAGPGKSNICFCVVFGQYCGEFISGWGLGAGLCLHPVLKFPWYLLAFQDLKSNIFLQVVRRLICKVSYNRYHFFFTCGDSNLYWGAVNCKNVITRARRYRLRRFLVARSWC